MADAELKASLTQAAVQWEQLATETGHRASEFSNPDLPWIPQFYLCRRRSAASSERASVMRTTSNDGRIVRLILTLTFNSLRQSRISESCCSVNGTLFRFSRRISMKRGCGQLSLKDRRKHELQAHGPPPRDPSRSLRHGLHPHCLPAPSDVTWAVPNCRTASLRGVAGTRCLVPSTEITSRNRNFSFH